MPLYGLFFLKTLTNLNGHRREFFPKFLKALGIRENKFKTQLYGMCSLGCRKEKNLS